MLDNSEFKILIVDDQKVNIDIVLGLLEDDGYKLSYNTNPKKALERIYEEEFDLILLDINMPELNGIEVCKRIKRDAKLKDTPIIFLSAADDTDTITNAFKNGGIDYITKPFNGLELTARVRTHIELRRYIKELQLKQEKLAQIVATDSITGLPNRLRFISIIKKEILQIKESPSRLSLAYIKIDNLSKINSLYGYKNGDKIINNISVLLKKNLKHNYTLARLFSADFVLLMPNTSLEAAKTLSKKLLNLIRKDTLSKMQITCSIGVSEYNLDENHEAFIQRAATLMEEVSSSGGNMML